MTPPQAEVAGPLWILTGHVLNIPTSVSFYSGESIPGKTNTAVGYWALQILFLLCTSDPDKSLKLLMSFSFFNSLFMECATLGMQPGS